ncbi:aldehyde dehydrogenase family protein [Amycolatopsis cihanbeyliensis]|uniref:Acyl-CoA reductase-like NAD-dependent aldehyde dehydrogenase n=1 Tax=Amycolatopsis cihanbeyliensis TaxID=1128664 RepID=A0A542DPV4_AMYCI|nr:aldehyde dehydrogenase [Amycolatopsis cihanbeyliensis]TQJ05138.1 acyl-CoA reductase-like NAD-dependent aldehyde dehydrogenase [Amycolatopsis cihanbeyliensis]
MKTRVYPAYIGGRDITGDNGQFVHTVSTRSILENTFPSLRIKQDLDRGIMDLESAGEAVVGACAVADEAMAELALESAAKAAPVWARRPLAERIEIGHRISRSLVEHGDALVEILVAEGMPVSMAEGMIKGIPHTGWSRETLEFCATQLEITRSDGVRTRTVRRVPDGVVCVNPPQNAATPNALAGITALLSGNTVVVRAPRGVALSCMYTMREVVAPVLEEAGAPPGTLNAFCGAPMLDQWLDSPHVDDIVFYGGSKMGLEFERKCIAAGKKPILELAGNDCCVVWRDADLDLAVESLTAFFANSGQICNVPNQVIVHPAIADELIAKLVVATQKIQPGYPDEPGVVLTPVLGADWFEGCLGEALAKGATLVHGGRRLEVDGTPSDTGFFIEPAIIRVDGLPDARSLSVVRDETFFPLLPVIVPGTDATDEELFGQMLDFVNSNGYGLRNSVFVRDDAMIERFLAGVANGGTLMINDQHTGFLPFLPNQGGPGLTGGVFGEANYFMLRTSRLQGVSIVRPAQ